ncbi:MAG: YraN family protein [Limnochordales bacterium]|jgi:TIGR00252 family protein|nr:YraN family protein [Bacillota bacterium]
MASPREPARRGRAAEEAAAALLQQQGWQILRRNYRTRRGEIDLIARDGATIVFVEVKARRAGETSSLEAVDARKRRRIVRAALEFLASRRLRGVAVRFDVVTVVLGCDGRPQAARVLKNAFAADE